MPSIPFPAVPAYPGVPAIPRATGAAVAPITVLAIGIGTLAGVIGSAMQQPTQWGIFDSSGNQLGGSNATNGILAALASQITGSSTPTLSTYSFDYTKETTISDFPIEMGSFASFNKVERPGNPTVTLSFAGSESDRTTFLNAIDAACKSTGLYSVMTPEIQYVNYNIERYAYRRRAANGATLLTVEISLKEIRQVSAAISQSASAPITNPQNPNAASQINNGAIQGAPPEQSTLRSIMGKF